MKQKQIELMKCLMGFTSPVTSTELAEQLGVSKRTVKSFIKEINESSEQKVIQSSNLGYHIAKGYIPSFGGSDNTIPQNQKERSHFIIKTILIEHKAMDVFDFCELLFVSYSTLKLTIAEMNQTYLRFKVRFVVENGKLGIAGTENDKRRLVSHVIFEETNSRFLDLKSLEDTFAKEKIQKISVIVKTFFQTNGYYLNDFSFANLVLHFLILVERVQQGQYLNRNSEKTSTLKESIVETLIKQIEDGFIILLSEDEREEISILVRIYGNYSSGKDEEELKKAIGKDIMSSIYEVVKSIHEIFMVELMNDNFMPTFYLHMKGLLLRISQNTYNKNPMIDNIKKECRIIYDIAIYISIALEKKFNIEINEDETGYIALHVGAELERQKQNKSKIKSILLCPDYYGMQDKILSQLNLYFGNDIYIVSTIASPSEREELGLTFDLMFTTIEMPVCREYEVIQITPFSIQEKKFDISEKIEKVRLKEKKRILKTYYNDFFDERLLYINKDFETMNEVFITVCGDMYRYRFVDKNYEQQVREREKASSTAFGDLALPHSMKMNAKKTCIAVIISKKKIRWDENKGVHIVLLTAINHSDRSHFTNIYEALLSVFDNPQAMKQMYQIGSFDEFISFLNQV